MTGAAMPTRGQLVDGKYQIVRKLGEGGMGAVYEATHVGTHRRVALKVIISEALAAGPDVIVRFQREAKASGSIDSLHVVQVLDTGVDPTSKNPYMVMELLNGEDVLDLVRRTGPLAPDLAARIIAQACLGLQRAHDTGIVHRDIKSANLYLSARDGGEVQLKILDFGIAKVRADPVHGGDDHHLTTTGSMIGSPLYMSPEQARSSKHLDQRADIWSLGVVLYEMLTGTTPHYDKTTLGDLIVAICVEPMPPVQKRAPWVPAELAAIVGKALERDPAARFQSAAEMHAALMRLLPGGTTVRSDMLVPLTPEMRAHVAPTFAGAAATGPGAPPVSPAFVQSASTPGIQLAAGTTNPELGASSASRPAGPMRWVAFAVVVLGVIGLAFVGVAFARKSAQQRSVPTATAIVATLEPPPPPPPASAAPVTKTVRVAITAPSGASVELDGSTATIADGSIAITGTPGSLHKVRVKHGEASVEQDVTVLESGAAMPPKIELVAKPVAKAGAAAPKPAAAPASAAAPKPATTSADPAIKKDF